MESNETLKQQQQQQQTQTQTQTQHGDQSAIGVVALAEPDAADEVPGSYELAPAGLSGRRPLVFDKMESLVREMQDPENGVPVRSQKLFLTSIPSAFMGYDMIEWLMERLNIEDSVEAIHMANLLCQHGYFFPVGECNKGLAVKDDSSLYRFQTPYYWPSQNHNPENSEYLIYLYKRSLRNKQKHGLEDYELEALNRLKKQMAHKWEFIVMQAEEQVRLAKDRKKGDKIVTDSQERAYWRAYRPPPTCLNCLEQAPYPINSSSSYTASAGSAAVSAASSGSSSSSSGASGQYDDAGAAPVHQRPPFVRRWRNTDELKAEVEFLRSQLVRARIKVSAAAETLQHHSATYAEYDPFVCAAQPSNPWLTDDPTYWILNAPIVDMPTEKRAKKWAISIEDLVSDQTGLQELTNYLRKEYSHENIRFWLATNQLRTGPVSRLHQRVQEIYEEFLAPGAPCEINIDGRTMDRVQNEMKRPSRFTFDKAAEHVYNLLLKKDCYPRFVRSEHYKQILANALQPSQKKRFFSFGATGKKKSIVAATAMGVTTGSGFGHPAGALVGCGASSARRRGSIGERSLSGSPPDQHASQQHQHQQHHASAPLAVPAATSSLLLASTSASTAAASAGLSGHPAITGSPSSASCSTVKSPGDECEAPYRGDMPGPRSSSNVQLVSTQAAPPSVAPPSAHLQSTVSESSPVPIPIGNRSSAEDVCPWEATSQPGTSQARLVQLTPGASLDPDATLAAPGSSPARTVSASLSCSVDSSHPSTDLDVCPWESAPGRRTPVPHQKNSVERCAEDAVCPWESQELAAGPELSPSPKRPTPHATPPPPPVASVRHAENQTPTSTKSPSEVSVSVSIPSKQPSPVSSSGRSGHTRKASASGSAVTVIAPVPAEQARTAPSAQQHQPQQQQQQQLQQQQPVEKSSAKISEICPWEDEESCKVDKPFVKTYATLGYL